MIVTLPYSPYSHVHAFRALRVSASALVRAARARLPPLRRRLHADRTDDRAGDCRRDRRLCDSGVSGLSGAQPRGRGPVAGVVRADRGGRKRRERQCVRRRLCVAARHAQRRIRSTSTTTPARSPIAFTTRVAPAGSNTLTLVPSVPDNADAPTARVALSKGSVQGGRADVGMFRRRQNGVFVAGARRGTRARRCAHACRRISPRRNAARERRHERWHER